LGESDVEGTTSMEGWNAAVFDGEMGVFSHASAALFGAQVEKIETTQLRPREEFVALEILFLRVVALFAVFMYEMVDRSKVFSSHLFSNVQKIIFHF